MTTAKFPRFLLFALCLAAVAGCGGGKDDTPAGGAQAETRSGGPAGQPEEPAVPVAVAPAELGAISSYYKATATLEAEKEAQVLARVAGVIAALSAEEGDRVVAGAALLRIDNNEYRLRADQAAAAAANLRARFQRLQAMRDEDLATDEEFEAARSELARAEADEGLARLNLSYTEVVAPFGGRVTRRLASVGQNVSVGTPLFALADFDPLLAKVHVPSREFNKLRQDQDVELVLDSVGRRVQGRIKLISPVIDPASGTIKITIEIPSYPEGTRPGDFAQVQIVTERRDGAVLVPRSAVLTDKGETVVYVAAGAAGDTAERRVVEVGFTDDERAQILTGLAAAERVVVKGQRSLKHGSKLKVLAEGAGS
jgi:membrane fusion protein (multidrug efflux system)